MTIATHIQNSVIEAVEKLYAQNVTPSEVPLSITRKEIAGDYTITVFGLAKKAQKNPAQLGDELGQYLVENVPLIANFNVIQGFLNLTINDSYWIEFLNTAVENPHFGQLPPQNERVMVEYSSPNTNKPLHLGHIRNILLGWSTAKILAAAGYDVVRTKVVNDRGIAICKSMLAWQLFGEGKTPQSEGIKGDHFVGDFYVLFEKKFQEEYKTWQVTRQGEAAFEQRKKTEIPLSEFFKENKNEYFNKYSALGAQARQMLLDWENGDAETVALWQQMNNWVYEGFDATYEKLGVNFDKKYYESNTYTLGKDIIEIGLEKNVFYKKPDNSVWIDLTDVKLDHKVVLRADGTSVYITQDIGMARLREAEFHCQKVVYVVADEQNYHFQVLFEILKKLGEPYAKGLFHLSYGMVELPSGRMKSREGTVVDADDLVAEVIAEAQRETEERGSLSQFSPVQKAEIERQIGLAALKYHIVKVNPKKKMVFDPKESVDLQGHTGPYIQYAFVRANGVVRDAPQKGIDPSVSSTYAALEPAEKEIILHLFNYNTAIEEAAKTYDPSVVANFTYELAKAYNKFWHDCPILRDDLPFDTKLFRIKISKLVAHTLHHGLDLLGVEVPERM